jgi:DNA-binding NarL/FixJ family response regulator
MDLTTLDPFVLRELAKLAEQKVALAKQIAEIDAKINAVANGNKAPKAARGVKAPKVEPVKKEAGKKPAKTGKRGQLKEQIISLLSKVGVEGLSVKEITKELGVKNQNVHVWFSTTGKKVPGITKLQGARYALIPPTQQPEASSVSDEQSPA